ncbi:MAG TPA: hypothetical protein VK701_05905 [Solirubrobacteraceae bacterium]|nr:hypothetical protein [Solirubrobacteraceae bacterium]
MTTPLQQLSEAVGRDFPNLFAARELTATKLAERSSRLRDLVHDEDVAIVLMGSWGRSEVTSGSDDDYMVLVTGNMRDEVRPAKVDIEAILDRAPGKQGIFGEPVWSRELIEKIGLDQDSNANLSRRMLFLLESIDATNPEFADTARDQLLERYLDESVKHYRPPRFLLNDVIRYWRTMCVDFAGKEYEGPEKWGLRNVKLRTARKVLFAGGLLPVLECAQLTAEEMPNYLREQLGTPPVDRIAVAFLRHGAADPGGRALGAYDDFLGVLDDERKREELNTLTRAEASSSAVFAEAARLGEELEQGLLALLFETDTLPKLVREFGIF